MKISDITEEIELLMKYSHIDCASLGEYCTSLCAVALHTDYMDETFEDFLVKELKS